MVQKDTHVVVKDLPKVNHTLNNCLINHNITSYYSEPLNTCGCLICHIYQ